VEILVIIVIAVLILGVAVGPLLAMRSPAEADKLTPGADPASRSGKEPDASETPPSRPRQAHRGPAAGRATCADDGPRGYDLFKKRRTAACARCSSRRPNRSSSRSPARGDAVGPTVSPRLAHAD